MSDAQGGPDQLLLVGTRKVVRQPESDPPYPQAGGSGDHDRQKQTPSPDGHPRSVARLKYFAWALALALGALQASVTPYQMSSEDIVSYLDVADGFTTPRSDVVVNGYWSPLYPAVLAAARAVSGVSRLHEFPLVRAVNFAVWILTIFAFDYLLRQVRRAHTDAVARTQWVVLPEWVPFVAGYAVFLWASLHWIGLRSDTPDLAASACVYMAAGLLIAGARDGWSSIRLILLGAVAAFGFHARAALFPIALVLIVTPAFDRGSLRARLLRAVITMLAFLVIAGPFIAALSRQKHRFTFGDSGRINYAWLVNPGDYIIPGLHWQGGPPGFGSPKHPTRQIWPNPEAYEFNYPIGTFPPWSDPSYWYDGLELHFALGPQLRTIAANVGFYRPLLFWPLLIALSAVFAAGGGAASLAATLRGNWRLIVPAAALLAIYAAATTLLLAATPLQPSTRYVAAPIVLLACAMIAGVRVDNRARARRIVAGTTGLLAAAVAIGLALTAAADVRALREPYRDERLPEIVAALQRMGIRPGDKVAIAGRKGDHEFWARMDGVQIVSQMPDGDGFVRTPDRWRLEIRRRFAATGAKAVVYRRWFPLTMTPEWQQVLDTQYWVSLLDR